jgi:hypothetical protein
MQNDLNPAAAITITGSTLPKKVAAHMFSWMCFGLLASAMGVLLSVKNPSFFSTLLVEKGDNVHLQPMGDVLLLFPFAFMLLKGMSVSDWSYALIAAVFTLFAFISGVTLYFFMRLVGFDSAPVTKVFLSVAMLFALMAAIGSYTDKETSFIGLLLIMGSLGIAIIAALDIWLHAPQVQLVMSIGIIIIFTIVSALHMKQLRKVVSGAEANTDAGSKLALLGAFSIYIDFITVVAAIILVAGKAGAKNGERKDSNTWSLYTK